MEEEVYERSIFDEEISVTYGGFWERFGALFLDGLILAPLSIINYYNQSSWKSLPLIVVTNLAAIAYKPLLEYLYGATPGKKALSLGVVNSSYGQINLQEAILRNIFGIVTSLAGLVVSIYTFDSNLFFTDKIAAGTDTNALLQGAMLTAFYALGIFVLYLADAVCLIANNKKQSLHDLIAKTYVIRKH